MDTIKDKYIDRVNLFILRLLFEDFVMRLKHIKDHEIVKSLQKIIRIDDGYKLKMIM